MSRRVTLLGIPIDAVTSADAIRRLHELLEDGARHQVCTPNSEMLVESTRNPDFRSVLQASSLNIPDSAGLLTMARWTGQRLPERVTGVDTVRRFCATLGSEHPVFLLGAAPGVAEKAAEALRKINPRLHIVKTFSGSPEDAAFDEILRRVRETSPQILFVAFGSPRQELWIAKHLPEMPTVSIAMGVGGTFDFLAGRAKRAPGMFQLLGLEWLWRLMMDPWRWKRIWTAVVVFPWLVLRNGK